MGYHSPCSAFSLANAQGVILAAGRGERLRPLTDDRPKCLVELAGEPLLSRQVRVLRAVGVDDVRVVAGYRAESIEALGPVVLEARATMGRDHLLLVAAGHGGRVTAGAIRGR